MTQSQGSTEHEKGYGKRSGGSRFSKMRLWGICLALAFVAAVGCWLFVMMPFSPVGVPIVVSKMQMESGTELQLVQVYTGTSDPYLVSLLLYGADGTIKKEYYLDHEAPYWRGKLELVDGKVFVYWYAMVVGRFDIGTGTYWYLNEEGNYEEAAPLDPVIDGGNIAPLLNDGRRK